MNGQMFFCQGCHRLRPSQDGHLVRYVERVGRPTAEEVFFTPSAANRMPLTDGRTATVMNVIVCGNCIPAGVDSEPLSEIGVQPDEGALGTLDLAPFEAYGTLITGEPVTHRPASDVTKTKYSRRRGIRAARKDSHG